MWELLQQPYSSVSVYLLVGDAWGKQSYAQVVALQDKSLTFGYIVDKEIIALASIASIHPGSAWLNIWLQRSWRRSRKHYSEINLRLVELKKIIFDRLSIVTLLAVTNHKSVVRLAMRYGASSFVTVPNYYGPNTIGYFIVWA